MIIEISTKMGHDHITVLSKGDIGIKLINMPPFLPGIGIIPFL